jgi:hypothetical protein
MLPWQKKKKEEMILAAQKEAAETKTTVIDGKTPMDKVVETIAKETKPELEEPKQELGALEIGLINQHRATLEIQLKTIERIMEQNRLQEETNNLLKELLSKA